MKNKKLFAARMIFTLLSIAAVGVIFYHSSMNADASDVESDSVTGVIDTIFRFLGIPASADEFIVRKLAHLTEYTVLGALLSVTVYLYSFRRLRTFWITLPIGAAVALCDELIQTVSEGRSSEFRDVLIDCCGVLLAALTVQLILFLRYRGKRKKEGNEIERTDAK